MLSLNNIKATPWSRKTSKRVGRWNASKGSFSWRWMNGQNARSGGWVAPWFEWGQTPLFRRMPKLKGFSNAKFKKVYNIITFRDLELLASKWVKEVNYETLLANKMIKVKDAPVKLLAKGELKSSINLNIDKSTLSAIKAVEKAWWKISVTEEIKDVKEEVKVKKDSKTKTPKAEIKEDKVEKEEKKDNEKIEDKLEETSENKEDKE